MSDDVKFWLYWCLYTFSIFLIFLFALDDWGDAFAFVIGLFGIIYAIRRERPPTKRTS